MNSHEIREINRLRLIALATNDPVVKEFCLYIVKENEQQAKAELSHTCWAEDIEDLRTALIEHNRCDLDNLDSPMMQKLEEGL